MIHVAIEIPRTAGAVDAKIIHSSPLPCLSDGLILIGLPQPPRLPEGVEPDE
jgi:hypothetical protein